MPQRDPERATPALRVFFATWPDTRSAQALTELAQRVALAAQGRPGSQERLHVTLAFVGNTPVARMSELAAIGDAVARQSAPFVLTLDRLGWFRNAAIAWIGCRDAPATLHALANDMRARLAAGAFPVDERPYRAHVSLARRCRQAPDGVAFEPIEWRVEAITLHASKLGSAGPDYSELARWTMGPP